MIPISLGVITQVAFHSLVLSSTNLTCIIFSVCEVVLLPSPFSQSHRTALEEAVHGNHTETIKLLMKASSRHKANVSINGVEFAHAFCHNRWIDEIPDRCQWLVFGHAVYL